ncbi:MAG: succinylglutamate desuccinylase/aspartoacylase family protein [Sandaracinaceae bacterium]
MPQATLVRDPALHGVTRISHDPSFPRPHVGILGGVHGNERCGIEAIHRLEKAVTDGELAPIAGTWVLIQGNPAAVEEGRRFTRGGADLNRLFDLTFVDELPRERWSPEHERAHVLEPVLSDLDALLDLHSATSPTPPFAIINDLPAAAELARRLGFGFVTHGWGGPGLLMDKVTIGIMQRVGRPAVSVECGQHDDPETVESAWGCALAFLRACDSLDGEAPAGEPKFLGVVEIISRPSEGFRFTRPLNGLERIEAGEVIAADRIAELRVREACYVLMPNDGVPVGRDMVFLAREAMPSHPEQQ